MAEGTRLAKNQVLLLLIGVPVAAFLGIVAGSHVVRTEPGPDLDRPEILLEKGQIFPDTAFVGLDGRPAGLPSLLQGKKSLLVFLSTECGACGLLTDQFNGDYPGIGPEHRLIGISFEPVSTLDKFRKDRNLAFPLVQDALGKFTDRYKIDRYPTVVGVNEKGEIAFIAFGYRAGRKLGDYLKDL